MVVVALGSSGPVLTTSRPTSRSLISYVLTNVTAIWLTNETEQTEDRAEDLWMRASAHTIPGVGKGADLYDENLDEELGVGGVGESGGGTGDTDRNTTE